MPTARPPATTLCFPPPRRRRARRRAGLGCRSRNDRSPRPKQPRLRLPRLPCRCCPGPPSRYATPSWSPVRWPARAPGLRARATRRAPPPRRHGPPAPARAPPGSSRSGGTLPRTSRTPTLPGPPRPGRAGNSADVDISRDSARVVRRLVVAASGGRPGLTSYSPTQAPPRRRQLEGRLLRCVRCVAAQGRGAAPRPVTPCQPGPGRAGPSASYALCSGSFMATIRKSAPSSAPHPSEHSCRGHRATGSHYHDSSPSPAKDSIESMASYVLAGANRVGP